MIDGVELGTRIARRELTATETAAAALERAPAKVFLTHTAERARREAAGTDARAVPASPLDGVPVAWKDLFDVADTITTAGSVTRIDRPAARSDSALVARLARAGMVCIGKTGLSEFAFSGLGVNPHFGTPTLPADEPLVPGGSSAGSAVAVALGVVPVAIGTDTSGSVRVPAAFCGVVGYKASEGRYPGADMLPLSPTLDSVGILARSVRDVVATDALLTGRAPATATRGARFVVPAGELVEDCTSEVRHRFAEITGPFDLRALPALAEAQQLMDEHGTIVEADALQRYRHLLDPRWAGVVDPGVLRRLASARDDVGIVRRARPRLRRQLAQELDGALLVCPTVRHTPPPLAPLLADDDLYDRTNRRTLRTTMLLSHLGMPGVSLPLGGGVGLLVSAPFGQDDRLLAAAGEIERRLHAAATG